jgi:hypothetical protein
MDYVLLSFLTVGALLMYLWLRDIIFYWKNNWDFSLPHGPDFFLGVEGDMSNPISNRTRGMFAYPISIALILIAILITYTA